MKERIIEIVALGQPQSLIQRENAPITELIKTDSLVEELNKHLRLYNVVGRSEQLKALLEKLLNENMCSVVGDELIEEALKGF